MLTTLAPECQPRGVGGVARLPSLSTCYALATERRQSDQIPDLTQSTQDVQGSRSEKAPNSTRSSKTLRMQNFRAAFRGEGASSWGTWGQTSAEVFQQKHPHTTTFAPEGLGRGSWRSNTGSQDRLSGERRQLHGVTS